MLSFNELRFLLLLCYSDNYKICVETFNLKVPIVLTVKVKVIVFSQSYIMQEQNMKWASLLIFTLYEN